MQIPVLLLTSLIVLASSFDARVARAQAPAGVEQEETAAANAEAERLRSGATAIENVAKVGQGNPPGPPE